jgi:hypothetical protein
MRTIIILLYTAIYLRFVPNIVASKPCNIIRKLEHKEHLNYSTILLNCQKPCQDSINGLKSVYDNYHMFQFKLNKYQMDNLNSTLGKLTEKNKSAKYVIIRDQDVSLTKFQLWWRCSKRHNIHLRNRLNFVDKHQFNNWLGYSIRNLQDLYEIYNMQISNKTGHVLVLQPAMFLNKKATYLNLFNFILKKFELSKENFDNYVDLYSLTTIHVLKGDTSKSYNTVLTIYKDPNASESFQGTQPTFQKYGEEIIYEEIHTYYKNESVDIIPVEPQLNVTNINAAIKIYYSIC